MASIALSGALAQRPGRPGHAWVFLNYLLGLRRLGHEVLFIDRLDAGVMGAAGAHDAHKRWLSQAMAGAGMESRYSALLDDGRTLGLSLARLHAELADCELLLNVNGYLRDEQLLAAPGRRVYLDIDPGFAQMWEAMGLTDMLAGHDDFVTVGTNVGSPSSAVPTGGRDWIPTLPPVVLEHWPVSPPSPDGALTSVGSWRGPFDPIEFRGETYGLRAHEFRRFAELPERAAAPFALALEIDEADAKDRALLDQAGWRLVDPLGELHSFSAYRAFICSSLAEISIAKGMYVKTRGGWFSDRSASYLASGRPVIAQDTGFGQTLACGRGLLCFSDLDGAVRAVDEVLAEPYEHSTAARAVAERHLDSDVVLGALMNKLGVR